MVQILLRLPYVYIIFSLACDKSIDNSINSAEKSNVSRTPKITGQPGSV